METITSRNNPLIKQVAKLCASTAERRRQGVFVLEGVRLCFDVLQTDLAIRQVFVTSGCQSRHPGAVAAILAAGRDAYLISDPVADKLAATGHTQGMFCVCEQPAASGGLQAGGHYILLENLQDPSNVGAILRTAEAFGLDGVLLAGGADPYGEKCIRASMGSILRMPLYLYDDIGQAAAACT
ncbi:MAG: RNA methyltransferase, partial [Clostridiales bacterium]|nr:RNA methyltransferase [Clostridiales bacterium]